MKNRLGNQNVETFAMKILPKHQQISLLFFIRIQNGVVRDVSWVYIPQKRPACKIEAYSVMRGQVALPMRATSAQHYTHVLICLIISNVCAVEKNIYPTKRDKVAIAMCGMPRIFCQ
jgi:translation elongation factor EF-G